MRTGACKGYAVGILFFSIVVSAQAQSHSAVTSWAASTSSNVIGYNVYRATTSGGPYTKLNSSLVSELSYTDTTVQGGLSYYYVATSVDSGGAESVYSNEAQATIPADLSYSFTASPSSGTGNTQTFTFTFSGATFAQGHALINSAINGASGCYLMYQTLNNGLYLLDDSGTQFLGPLTPGGSGTLLNSQCGVQASSVVVSNASGTLSVKAPISFATAFTGAKNIYLAGFDTAWTRYNWVTAGTWTVGGGTSGTAFSVNPASGSGASQSFTFSFSGANFAQGHMLFNSTIDGARACYLMYQASNNGLYLADDSGSQFLGPVTPGSSANLSNSQCSVQAASVVASSSGTVMTVTAPVSFAAAFNGTKNTYLAAFDTSWNRYNWVTAGAWTVSAGGPVFGVTPSSGSGASQTFTFSFSGANFVQGHVLINSSINGTNACYLMYQTLDNGLYMLDDSGNVLVGPVTPGGGGTLSNSQCSVPASGVVVASSGTNLTVTAPVTFKAPLNGSRNIYLAGFDTGWNRYNWVPAGNYIVSAQ